MSKAELLSNLEKSCLSCQKCSLSSTRTNVVFGDGNPNSKIMFVGEGPGEQEDLQGFPFVGRAGQLLDQMLDIINLDRSKYYICNVVKCRPPHNRDPQTSEQDSCSIFINQQIEIIQPQIIVCLGRIAATRLISSEFKITRDHGKWFKVNNIWITAIYHPSALLRDEGKRPETFDDLKSIRQKMQEVI